MKMNGSKSTISDMAVDRRLINLDDFIRFGVKMVSTAVPLSLVQLVLQ
jgi:hypothetical protein